jgi:hypothetical protein
MPYKIVMIQRAFLLKREGENLKILILSDFCKLFDKALIVVLASAALAMCLQIV